MQGTKLDALRETDLVPYTSDLVPSNLPIRLLDST